MKITSKYTSESEIVIKTTDVMKFLRDIENDSFQLIITSPPYNIGKSYEEKESIDTYLANQENIIKELVRTTKSGGSICWQTGNYVNNGEVFPLDIYFYSMFKKYGMKLRNRIVWHFRHGLHASKRFSGRYETILWFTKGDDYTFNLDDIRVPSKYPGKRYYKGPKKGQLSGNPKGKNPSDVWEILINDWDSLLWDIPNVKANHPEKTIHPCQFPVELVERCVLALTNEGDVVFDPFGGVGSTAVAAIKNDRRVVIVDKERKYMEEARKRVKLLLSGNLKTRDIGTPIHKPNKKDKVAAYPKEWEGKK